MLLKGFVHTFIPQLYEHELLRQISFKIYQRLQLDQMATALYRQTIIGSCFTWIDLCQTLTLKCNRCSVTCNYHTTINLRLPANIRTTIFLLKIHYTLFHFLSLINRQFTQIVAIWFLHSNFWTSINVI